jgi:hypothetical protein
VGRGCTKENSLNPRDEQGRRDRRDCDPRIRDGKVVEYSLS